MKQLIKYMVLIVCACSCWSCMDDEIGQEEDYGKLVTVNLSMDFSDMQVVTPGSRSAGDAIGKMTDVCVLFYKTDGTLAMDGANPIYYYGAVNNLELATMKKTVHAGVYKVVAVANMGNLVTEDYDKVKTLDGLKSISLAWKNEVIGANNQMFGFFQTSSGNNPIDDAIANLGMSRVAPTSYDAPELSLSGDIKLYAKLYRAVAKVTVAFNGEGLNANVFVTIKSIRLGNLPTSCPLWVENKGVENVLVGVDQSEKLTDAEFGVLKVTNRGVGESLFPKDAHSQTGLSLFMFENRQGTAETPGVKDKIIDKKPCGAFIEIEALYANEGTGGSNGKITYRYMLGEDVPNKYDNYNLTRNRHYKVTLMLQKSGKEEPYWRVDYEENPSINLPTEVNISYRNSAKLDIPFTVEDSHGGIKGVKAEIIDNPWYDDLVDGHRDATLNNGALEGLSYGFLAWAGNPSSNSSYGMNKTWPVIITAVDGKYKLSVQTEALGFMTDRGDERGDSFTGYNNYSNPRTAKIRVTVEYHSGEPKTAEVKVVQVPRVVNPIAVYRRWNNDAPFHIRLLNALGNEIESYGPWSAEVESGADWIRIRREGADYGTSFTSGEEGGAVRFYYKPSSKLGNEGETRCGVIVVRFSNFNVEHRIYIRQGYAPTAIGKSDNLWTSYNYIGVNANNTPQFTNSPMEEGAWLKLGNSVGILANNTDNTDKFESPPANFKMSDGTNLSWYQFSKSEDVTFVAPGYELPTETDITNLQGLKEYSGFGIGYDDNATETLAFAEDAQYTNPAMGRRGFVICDQQGRNLFFPTGKRGYGRRRDAEASWFFNGGLHYAHSIRDPLSSARPALIGLPKSMGAIYWSSGGENLSLNYSLSNIETANRDHHRLGYDACFARLMKAPDVVKFKRLYCLQVQGIDYYDDVVSITPWGNITDSTIVRLMGAYYTVSFKYHVEVDKMNNGLIIRVLKQGNTYEKKLSIRDLEAIRDGGVINF